MAPQLTPEPSAWVPGQRDRKSRRRERRLRTARPGSAVRDGDEYIVNGEKIWTSHTPTAEYCYLLVRTDREAEKHLGISILLVPMDTPGLEVYRIPAVGGVGDSSFANLRFSDMRVPVAARLGPENEGWPIVRKALAFERTGMPRYLNASIRLDKLVTWAKQHVRFTTDLSQLQVGDVIFYPHHVGVVVQVLADGTVQTADGDFGGETGWNAKHGPVPESYFAEHSSVELDTFNPRQGRGPGGSIVGVGLAG